MSTEITISRLKLTLLCVWSSDWTLHKANDLLDADIAAHNHGWGLRPPGGSGGRIRRDRELVATPGGREEKHPASHGGHGHEGC